jgi:hypothetical protein
MTMLRGIAICAGLSIAWAAHASGSGFRDQIDEDLSGGTSLYQQKLQLVATQKKLADEGKALTATGKALDQEQAALNQETDQHNQRVADQKAQLDKARQGCSNGGGQGDGNSTEQANACNNSAKAINQKSADINAAVQTLQQRQADLAARYDRYQAAIADWNQREQANVAALNRANKRLDNWLNFSYNFMAGADFQAAVASSDATSACGDGTSRIISSASAPLDDSARFILGCLKTVKRQLPKPAG